MFDLQVPFFRPLWLRLAVVAVALGWAGVEMATGAVGFAILFAALGLYAAWQLFVVWTPKDDTPERNDNG